MKHNYFTRGAWWFWIYFFRACGLFFLLSPNKLPQNEGRKIQVVADPYDVVIVFNPGGWGDATLERAKDFTPIMEGIQQTIKGLGYSSTIVPYVRTLKGLAGRCSGTKEQIICFKHNAKIQIRDLKNLASAFPEKRFILAGFSTGGGLNGLTLESLKDILNIYGITVGAPGWFHTHSSARSLVINNSNQDPVCSGDVNAIALAVIKTPFVWLRTSLKGENMRFALALRLPHHEYAWSSKEVGPPIVKFLKANFQPRD